jgi:hypothetical protein
MPNAQNVPKWDKSHTHTPSIPLLSVVEPEPEIVSFCQSQNRNRNRDLAVGSGSNFSMVPAPVPCIKKVSNMGLIREF